jgi:predicted membrane chloride channel (bestrophin family)
MIVIFYWIYDLSTRHGAVTMVLMTTGSLAVPTSVLPLLSIVLGLLLVFRNSKHR